MKMSLFGGFPNSQGIFNLIPTQWPQFCLLPMYLGSWTHPSSLNDLKISSGLADATRANMQHGVRLEVGDHGWRGMGCRGGQFTDLFELCFLFDYDLWKISFFKKILFPIDICKK